MPRRRKGLYFRRDANTPGPVVVEVNSRVRFSDVDAMGIVWFGRYPLYIEEGSAELGRTCGLTYLDYERAGLRAPIVEFHLDYFSPLYLDEEFIIRASLIWNEGARLDTEYQIIKAGGRTATSGYTVQLFTDVGGNVSAALPPLIQEMHKKWLRGEFS